MKEVLLIIEGENPQWINVSSGMRSIEWEMKDGTIHELEIDMYMSNQHSSSCFYATNINSKDLNPEKIRNAILSASNK